MNLEKTQLTCNNDQPFGLEILRNLGDGIRFMTVVCLWLSLDPVITDHEAIAGNKCLSPSVGPSLCNRHVSFVIGVLLELTIAPCVK